MPSGGFGTLSDTREHFLQRLAASGRLWEAFGEALEGLLGGSGRLLGGSGRLLGGSGKALGGSGTLLGGSGRLRGGSGRPRGGSRRLKLVKTLGFCMVLLGSPGHPGAEGSRFREGKFLVFGPYLVELSTKGLSN